MGRRKESGKEKVESGKQAGKWWPSVLWSQGTYAGGAPPPILPPILPSSFPQVFSFWPFRPDSNDWHCDLYKITISFEARARELRSIEGLYLWLLAPLAPLSPASLFSLPPFLPVAFAFIVFMCGEWSTSAMWDLATKSLYFDKQKIGS